MIPADNFRLDLEVQCLKSGHPISRPTQWMQGTKEFTAVPLHEAQSFPLRLGAAAPAEHIDCIFVRMGEFREMDHDDGTVFPRFDFWDLLAVSIAVDGATLPMRPAQVYRDTDLLFPADVWTSVINWPIVMDKPPFNSVFTLLMRTRMVERIEAEK